MVIHKQKLEANKDVLPNTNRSQAAERAENVVFYPCDLVREITRFI